MPKVRYVEHIVSEAGIETNPEKLGKNANWPKPQTAEEARRFIGFAGYYRRFINNFSHISKVLTDIMPSPQKKSNRKKNIFKSHGTGAMIRKRCSTNFKNFCLQHQS